MTTTRPPDVAAPTPEPTVTGQRRPPRDGRRITDWLVPTASVAATLVLAANVLAMLGRGFEFTDGGNSWNLLTDPAASPLTVTQAGHLEHVAFGLTGRHEVWFQRSTALASLLLAVVLAHLLLSADDRPRTTRSRVRDGALSVGMGAAAFTMLGQWQAPPNYKWLAIQGLLLAAIGLVARPARNTAGEMAAGLGLAVGGWLAFMAKPPSGAVLAVLALVHLAVRRTSVVRATTAVGAASVLVVMTAITLEGSVGAFLADLRASADLLTMLDPNHAVGMVLRPDLPPWSAGTTVVLVGVVVAVLALVAVGRGTPTRPPPSARRVAVLQGLLVLLAGLAMLIATSTWSWWPDYDLGQGVWALAPALAVAMLLLVDRPRDGADLRRHLPDVVLLLALPAAFAIGSGNNYWHEAGRAAVFWALASLPLLGLVRVPAVTRPTLVAVGVIATQVVTAALVHVGIRQPYRQDLALRHMDVTLDAPTPLEDVLVSPAQAAFIDGMVTDARAAGFRPGTGVIDLSGRSPGLLHLLGADPLGRSWLLGGFPGSIEVATTLLAAEGCPALARAWVVEGPDQPRSLAPGVPPAFGMDLDRDFRIVADHLQPDGERRRLLAPVRSMPAATAACEDALNRAAPDGARPRLPP